MTELEKAYIDKCYKEADPAFIEKNNVPGIYGILLNNEVVYVGKSQKMFSRWVAHKANAFVPDCQNKLQVHQQNSQQEYQ